MKQLVIMHCYYMCQNRPMRKQHICLTLWPISKQLRKGANLWLYVLGKLRSCNSGWQGVRRFTLQCNARWFNAIYMCISKWYTMSQCISMQIYTALQCDMVSGQLAADTMQGFHKLPPQCISKYFNAIYMRISMLSTMHFYCNLQNTSMQSTTYFNAIHNISQCDPQYNRQCIWMQCTLYLNAMLCIWTTWFVLIRKCMR